MSIAPHLMVEQEAYEIGYTPNRVMFEYQENDFISTQLFKKWANKIFFPMWRICDEEWNPGPGQFYCLVAAPATIQMSFLTRVTNAVSCPSFFPATHRFSRSL
jgi:hypothetical protein